MPNSSDSFSFQTNNVENFSRNASVGETMGVLRDNTISGYITRADGTVEIVQPVKNSRINAGALFVANQISGTVAAVANYMALGSTSLTIATTDTTLANEITGSGMPRASAAYGSYVAPSTVNGTASYTLTHTFTATATQTVNSVAIFNAVSAGTMLVEANLSQTYSMNSGDSLSLTYSFTI